MKKELDMRVVIGLIGILVIGLGVFAWRMFASSPASGNSVSPQQAGLGKPVYPTGAGGAQTQSGSPEGAR